MGILNVTPDSFSDGGKYLEEGAALAHARQLVAEGADLIDIGGESSRPGAHTVSVDEELARVMPVIRGLQDLSVPLSVDTTKPEVMRAVIDAGADMINDISALRAPGALEVAAASGVGVCLMHMQGTPRSMQNEPSYENIVAEVAFLLGARVAAAEAAGIERERLVIDPGFGFGKTSAHNFELLRGLGSIAEIGPPVLVGWSRKSSLAALTGRRSEDLQAASVAAALIAVQRGARILRVHDVQATRDALAVLSAVGADQGRS